MEMRRINNVAIITLDQRLSGGPSNVELTDLIRQLVSDGVAHVIFDCHNVELINSSGLGSLVAAHTTLHAHGGRCTLVAIPEKIRTLLSVTHLDSVFGIADTVEDALS